MSSNKPCVRSACAIANSLDIVGDKWSLLVVRDLLHGKHTYGELASSPERIPTNILADRLRRLEAAGILVSTPDQQRPLRYRSTLTPEGSALGTARFCALGQTAHPRYAGVEASSGAPRACRAGVEHATQAGAE